MLRLNLKDMNIGVELIRFNTSYVAVEHILEPLCLFLPACFNTSYVAVERSMLMLQLMLPLGFNTSYVAVEHHCALCGDDGVERFQYILCCG